MSSAVASAKKFERIVLNLIKQYFDSVALSVLPMDGAHQSYDFVVPDASLLGEIKFFSSTRIPANALMNIAFKYAGIIAETGYSNVLIVSTEEAVRQSVKIREKFNIFFWGMPELLYIANRMSGGPSEVVTSFRELLPFSDVASVSPRRPRLSGIGMSLRSIESAERIELFQGSDFCTDFNSLGHGPSDYKRFEKICEDALKYCLGEHLVKWTPQSRSDSGRSIMDLVARVASSHDFWTMVRSDFSSPYVVFEFKWYKEPIGQGQIYTTEKYLYQRAMRNASFIISGSGIDANGVAAAKGALREHGKLIVPLSAQDLCDMVQLKANGGDPVTVMADLVDAFLLGLER